MLGAGGTHFLVGADRLATSKPARDKNRDVTQMRQDFLRENRQGHRADVAAGLGAFDDDGIGAGADHALGQRQRRRERDQLGPAILHRAHRRAGRDATGQDDVADLGLQADADQCVQFRVHGDQVHAERLVCQRLRSGDLLRQLRRAHGAAGDHAETAGVGNRGHQMLLADPPHRAPHDRVRAAEERRTPRP